MTSKGRTLNIVAILFLTVVLSIGFSVLVFADESDPADAPVYETSSETDPLSDDIIPEDTTVDEDNIDPSSEDTTSDENTEVTTDPSVTDDDTPLTEDPTPAPLVAVTLSENGNVYTYTPASDATVRIEGFLHIFEEGAYGNEKLTMLVNGAQYNITLHSDGRIEGSLPGGFSVQNGVIIITGVNTSIDIVITKHTTISAVSEEPYFEEPSFEEPVPEDVHTEDTPIDVPEDVQDFDPAYYDIPASYSTPAVSVVPETIQAPPFVSTAEDVEPAASDKVITKVKKFSAPAVKSKSEKVEKKSAETRILEASSAPTAPFAIAIPVIAVLIISVFILLNKHKRSE